MTAYARRLFGIAAAFNFAAGAATVFLRSMLVSGLQLDPIRGSNIVIADLFGMFVALFGYAYLLIAINPARYRPYISFGAIGKLLAFACAIAGWLAGLVVWKLPALLSADLVFALLFLDYLRRSNK